MKKSILFSLLTFQQLIAQDVIHIYSCYGNAKNMIVEGRILDEREFQETKKEDGMFTNAWRKLGHILNDERKNVPVTLRLDKKEFQASTDDEGYFEFKLHFDHDLLTPNLPIELFLTNNQKVQTTTHIYMISKQKQTGIISDFDDTVIVSDVTKKLSLLYQLLLKNYKQREVVEGLSQRYRKILEKSPDKPLFFITGSPKQFHQVIEKFLNYHHFPKHTLITKKMHGENAHSIFKQQNYKKTYIEELITLYPQVEWILFGDSGEQDKKIYLDIAKRYPKHIKEIYIRNVESKEIEKISISSVQTS